MRTQGKTETVRARGSALTTNQTKPRPRAAATPASSRLLTTMAVVQANADQGRDYVANFEPFATERLQAWPEGEPVEPDALARAICEEWGVPSMPTGVAKILLKRAKRRDQIVTTNDGTCFPNAEKLLETPGISEKREEMLARINALEDAVVAYANEAHGLNWTQEDATAALLRLTEDFGVELAVARREGGLAEAPSQKTTEAVAVVYGFSRRALEEDPTNFDALVAMVQGTMVTNTIYFKDVGHVTNKLKELTAYLDTPVILRALGLATDPVQTAAKELIEMLREFNVPMRIFPHTFSEIAGVLEGIAGSMRRGRRGLLTPSEMTARNREAIDAMITRGWTSGEVETLAADLANQLADLGIEIEETPPHGEKEQIDEKRFEQVLDEVVGYGKKITREKDLKSLAAVARLRGRARPRDLAETNALFVTSNTSLVRASREFFAEADRGARVPHCMLDTALTAQLWVRSPHPEPELPRKLVIANSYAALNPGPELWERWIRHIQRLRKRGEVSDEQVQNLVYHSQAKSALFEVTHGDPGAIDETTVGEVLERFEAELRRPAEEEAAAARARADAAERESEEIAARLNAAEQAAEHATSESESLRDQVAGLSERVETQERLERDRSGRIDRLRLIAGYGVAGLTIAAFVVLTTFGIIEGRAAWASAITVLVLGSVGAWAWGTKREVKLAWQVLIALGAGSALWIAVWTVVGEEEKAKTPPAEPTRLPGRP